jgi:hypothetical protein
VEDHSASDKTLNCIYDTNTLRRLDLAGRILVRTLARSASRMDTPISTWIVGRGPRR